MVWLQWFFAKVHCGYVLYCLWRLNILLKQMNVEKLFLMLKNPVFQNIVKTSCSDNTFSFILTKVWKQTSSIQKKRFECKLSLAN